MRAMHFLPAVAALAALTALLTSLACLWILLSPLGRRLMPDQPNARSLHDKPVPRSGGIAIAAGVAAGAAFAPPELGAVLGIAGLLALLSLADDIFTLPTLLRLAAHLGAAGAVLTLEIGAAAPILFAVLLLAIAWYANLYNFMDGSDGLAGGMALIGFGTYGVASLLGGDFSFAAINLSVAAAACAFLFFNFPPAKVFMGDVGSIPLGFMAAVLGVAGWLRDDWPLWFAPVVFSPFIVDASWTLVKRTARGASVWQAHREHYYQQLVQKGWGHRKTALAEYGLMALMSGIAAAGIRTEPALQLATLIAVTLLYAGLIVALERSLVGHPEHHA